MAVSVVKITEPIGVRKNTNKNVNIYATAAAGAGSGMVLRQIMPVSKPELDYVLFGESGSIKENSINQAKKGIWDGLVKRAAKEKDNQSVSLFLERLQASKMYETAVANGNKSLKEKAVVMAKVVKEKIKAAPEPVKNEIKELTKSTINKVRAARVFSGNSLIGAIKQQRPISAYFFPGLALGTLAGFVYNVVGMMSED